MGTALRIGSAAVLNAFLSFAKHSMRHIPGFGIVTVMPHSA